MDNINMIRLVKILDIIIFSNIYFYLGIFTSYILYKYLSKPYDKKESKLRNFIQLVAEVGLLVTSVYLIRILVKSIPNPLDGLYGFDSSRVKELNGGVVLAFAFTFFMKEPISDKVKNIFITTLNEITNIPQVVSSSPTQSATHNQTQHLQTPGSTSVENVLQHPSIQHNFHTTITPTLTHPPPTSTLHMN